MGAFLSAVFALWISSLREGTGDWVNVLDLEKGIKKSDVAMFSAVSSSQIASIESDARRSWANLPCPPEPHTCGTIIRMLLTAPGYSINASTFSWPGSDDETYRRLWVLCGKMASRGPVSGTITRLMAGRHHDGYVRSRNAVTVDIRSAGRMPRLEQGPKPDPLMAELIARVEATRLSKVVSSSISGRIEASYEAMILNEVLRVMD